MVDGAFVMGDVWVVCECSVRVGDVVGSVVYVYVFVPCGVYDC